jgi:hypothetical protein
MVTTFLFFTSFFVSNFVCVFLVSDNSFSTSVFASGYSWGTTVSKSSVGVMTSSGTSSNSVEVSLVVTGSVSDSVFIPVMSSMFSRLSVSVPAVVDSAGTKSSVVLDGTFVGKFRSKFSVIVVISSLDGSVVVSGSVAGSGTTSVVVVSVIRSSWRFLDKLFELADLSITIASSKNS